MLSMGLLVNSSSEIGGDSKVLLDFWLCGDQHLNPHIVQGSLYCVTYLKVAKKEESKSSHHKQKNFVTMCGDGCQTYCGDHFTIYKYIPSLCGTPKTITML